MNWIIQDSNNQHKNWVSIYNAAREVGDNACFVSMDDKYTLEKIDEYSLVIGGDDFIDMCLNNRFLSVGVFRDEEFFNTDSYLKNFTKNYLNYDSRVVCFGSVKRMEDNLKYFIRPYGDSKEFDGGVYSIIDFVNVYSYLKDDFKISMASPKVIDAEWRFVVVNKRIISASTYVGDKQINDSITSFVYSCLNGVVTPEAFVIDVALTDGKLKIIECNTINSSNFYDCNIELIVLAMDKLMKKRLIN